MDFSFLNVEKSGVTTLRRPISDSMSLVIKKYSRNAVKVLFWNNR